MRSTPLVCALLAAALLAPGCRTLNRSRDRVAADDYPFEPAGQPSRIARATEPVVEKPAVEKPVAEAPVVEKPVAEKPAVEAPAPKKPAVAAKKPAAPKAPVAVTPTAKAPEIDTTPYEAHVVRSVDQVGKPDSYIDFVVPEGGGDQPVAITSEEGLAGSTGRHVPAPAPEPEPIPVVKPAPADSGWYVVQAGDILGRVAQKHGVSRQAILDANPSIKDPNKLRIGQKIKIPPRGTGITDKPKTAKKAVAAPKAKKQLPAKDGYTVYTVKKGDILGRIAIANKTTQKAILEANGLADANRIREGQQLYIPAPGAAKAVKAAEKPAEKPAGKSSGKSAGKDAKSAAEKPVDPPAAETEESPDQILRDLGF